MNSIKFSGIYKHEIPHRKQSFETIEESREENRTFLRNDLDKLSELFSVEIIGSSRKEKDSETIVIQCLFW